MAIGYYGQAIQGQTWVADRWGRCPAFICVLGFTATALIEGISSAGLSSEARTCTAIADGELLATGKAINFPLPKLAGGVSPALITRAIVSQLQLPLYIFNAGLLTTPPFPHIDLGGCQPNASLQEKLCP